MNPRLCYCFSLLCCAPAIVCAQPYLSSDTSPNWSVGGNISNTGTTFPDGQYCTPLAGQSVIAQLESGTTNTWRINARVYNLDAFTIWAPAGTDPMLISEINILYTCSDTSQQLRVTIDGSRGARTRNVGAIRTLSGSDSPIAIRQIILDDVGTSQICGWNNGAFDTAKQADFFVYSVWEMQAKSDMNLNIRLDKGGGPGRYIRSTNGSIFGYIGGPSLTGESFSTGVFGAIEAPNGSIGRMTDAADATKINASAFRLIRSSTFNATLTADPSGGASGHIKEFKVLGNAKGVIRARAIGSDSSIYSGDPAANPGYAPPYADYVNHIYWYDDPLRPAFQIGGEFDGMIVTGAPAAGGNPALGGIFGQMIIGSLGLNARVSINGDTTNANPTQNRLGADYNKLPTSLGNGTVGGRMAVGNYGVLWKACDPPIDTPNTPAEVCGGSWFHDGFQTPFIIEQYGPVHDTSTSPPTPFKIEMSDRDPASSGVVWIDVTDDFVQEAPRENSTSATGVSGWFNTTSTIAPRQAANKEDFDRAWMYGRGYRVSATTVSNAPTLLRSKWSPMVGTYTGVPASAAASVGSWTYQVNY